MSTDIAQQFLHELLQDLEEKALKLPALPEVAVKTRDAVDNEKASITDIAKVIASDAALSARLIQVTNKPLIQTGNVVDSLEMAVELLGRERTRALVFSMVMEQMFQSNSDLIDKKLRQIWEHSTTVAAISHALAAKFTSLSPVQAMLAGLVHDIGFLPLLSKAEYYPKLLENEAALDEIIGKLHARIGTSILKSWHFPEELLKVPAEHENLERNSAQTDYVDVVTVANLQSYLGSQHPLAHKDWSKVPAFSKIGISPRVNVIELEETAEDIREVQHILRS